MQSKFSQFKQNAHLPLKKILQRMHLTDEELYELMRTWKRQGLMEPYLEIYEELFNVVRKKRIRTQAERQKQLFDNYKLLRKQGESVENIALTLKKSSDKIHHFDLRWYQELLDMGMDIGAIRESMGLSSDEFNALLDKYEEKRRLRRQSLKKQKTANAIYAMKHLGRIKKEFSDPHDYLIFDLEGTQSPDELIEIAVIDMGGHVLMNTLVKPSNPIGWRITELTGITDEMAAQGRDVTDVMKELRDLAQGKTIMSWGTDYDTVLLRSASETSGILLDCEFANAQKIHMGVEGLTNQIALHKALDLEKQSHRALDDCYMVLEVLKRDTQVPMEE